MFMFRSFTTGILNAEFDISIIRIENLNRVTLFAPQDV